MRTSYRIILAAGAVLAIAGTARGFSAATPVEPDGRVLYLKNCRQCHSATGLPSSETKHKYPKIKALNDSGFLASISNDSILAVIKNGAGKDMKSFSDRLNHEEMEAVLKYVRTLPSKKSK